MCRVCAYASPSRHPVTMLLREHQFPCPRSTSFVVFACAVARQGQQWIPAPPICRPLPGPANLCAAPKFSLTSSHLPVELIQAHRFGGRPITGMSERSSSWPTGRTLREQKKNPLGGAPFGAIEDLLHHHAARIGTDRPAPAIKGSCQSLSERNFSPQGLASLRVA